MSDFKEQKEEQMLRDAFPSHDDPMGDESAGSWHVNLRKSPRELSKHERQLYVEETRKMWAEIRECFRSRK